MTIIIPTVPTSQHFAAEMLSPLRHFGHQITKSPVPLRTQEVLQDDGSTAHVPFLSGSSLRHCLREQLAWHLVRTLKIQPGSLHKRIVDLLWQGGTVARAGHVINLDLQRRTHELMPGLTLFGFASGSHLFNGTLRMSDMLLVCQENQRRLRSPHPPKWAATKPATTFRTTEFGIRQDVSASPAGELASADEETESTQMIFEHQLLKTGAWLEGEVMLLTSASESHRMVLDAAITLWAPDGIAWLGGGSGRGYGQARIHGLQPNPAALEELTDHIASNGDAILKVLKDVAKCPRS